MEKKEIKWALALTFLILSILIFFGLRYNINLEEAEIISLRFFNSILFGAAVLLTYYISMLLTKNYTVSLISAFSLIFTFLFVNSFIGWTHTLVVFLILLGFYSFLRFEREKKFKFLVLLSFSIGFTFVVRYLDVLFFIPILIYSVYKFIQKNEYKNMINFLFLILIFALPAFIFHYVAFGDPLLSPYHMRPYSLPPHPKTNIIEFRFDRLPINLYNIFISYDPNNVLPSTEDTDYKFRFFKSSIFQSSPFLIFSILGFMSVRKILDRKIFLILISSILTLTIFYASWKFYGGGWTTNMRYFSPIIPFLAIFAVFFIFNKINFKKVSKLFFVLMFVTFLLLSKIFFDILREQSYFSNYHPKQFLNGINLKFYLIFFAISLIIIYLFKRNIFIYNYGLTTIFFFLLFLGFVMNFFVDGYFSFYGSKSDLFILNLMNNDYILIFTFIFLTVAILIQVFRYVFS
ncbi:MAG: phospholipid carrier-dependent glycosyltransferase [Candidatus Aenigmatarchaeota archaeon]